MSALIQIEELTKEFELSRSKLRSFVFRITANTADTEDIIQDTYIRAATKLETFKGMSSLKTWLFSIASNLAKDHLRAKKRWPANAMDLARDESMKHPDVHLARFLEINHASPMGKFEVREHIGFCFTCIGKTLPLEQQLAIPLKEIFDFQVAEIAVILGKTQGGIKHRCSTEGKRCRRSLIAVVPSLTKTEIATNARSSMVFSTPNRISRNKK